MKYITNRELIDEITKSQAKGRINDQVGLYIMQLCERLSRKRNFAGYSYREEFVAEGIAALTQNILKFDIEKSENPFAYATRIAWNAMVRVITKEQHLQKTRQVIAADMGADWANSDHYGAAQEYAYANDPHDELDELIHIGERPEAEWRQVPGYPRALCSRDGRVIRITGAAIEREGSHNQYVRLSGKRYPWTRVIAATWHGIPLEDDNADDASEWRAIDDDYRVNVYGQVQHKTSTGAWRTLKPGHAPYYTVNIRGRGVRRDDLIAAFFSDSDDN